MAGLVGRENVYICAKCGGLTVTIDVDEGKTPFIIGCMVREEPPLCPGPAVSCGYPPGPRPANIPAPMFEWYKPTGADFDRLSDMHKSWVEQGGLVPRRRVQ